MSVAGETATEMLDKALHDLVRVTLGSSRGTIGAAEAIAKQRRVRLDDLMNAFDDYMVGWRDLY